MGVFIAAALLIVSNASMGFKQGQADPDANSLFDSQSSASSD